MGEERVQAAGHRCWLLSGQVTFNIIIMLVMIMKTISKMGIMMLVTLIMIQVRFLISGKIRNHRDTWLSSSWSDKDSAKLFTQNLLLLLKFSFANKNKPNNCFFPAPTGNFCFYSDHSIEMFPSSQSAFCLFISLKSHFCTIFIKHLLPFCKAYFELDHSKLCESCI